MQSHLQVTPGGKAARGGVKEGDYVLAINRELTDDMLHFNAQQVFKAAGTSLQLKLSEWVGQMNYYIQM